MEVKVVIDEGKEARVEFDGMWTRRMIDITYKNMLLQLPRHMAKVKQDLESKQVQRKKGGLK